LRLALGGNSLLGRAALTCKFESGHLPQSG
jgi:hypothetical protein